MQDLCELTRYTRDQMRGLLDVLPPRGARDGRPRAATLYSMQDLVFIALCCRLEQHCGLKRDKVAVLSPHISAQLEAPRARGLERLLIRFDLPSVEAADEVDGLSDGLVFAMDPVFRQVDKFLLPDGDARSAVINASLGGVAAKAHAGRAKNPGKD